MNYSKNRISDYEKSVNYYETLEKDDLKALLIEKDENLSLLTKINNTRLSEICINPQKIEFLEKQIYCLSEENERLKNQLEEYESQNIINLSKEIDIDGCSKDFIEFGSTFLSDLNKLFQASKAGKIPIVEENKLTNNCSLMEYTATESCKVDLERKGEANLLTTLFNRLKTNDNTDRELMVKIEDALADKEANESTEDSLLEELSTHLNKNFNKLKETNQVLQNSLRNILDVISINHLKESLHNSSKNTLSDLIENYQEDINMQGKINDIVEVLEHQDFNKISSLQLESNKKNSLISDLYSAVKAYDKKSKNYNILLTGCKMLWEEYTSNFDVNNLPNDKYEIIKQCIEMKIISNEELIMKLIDFTKSDTTAEINPILETESYHSRTSSRSCRSTNDVAKGIEDKSIIDVIKDIEECMSQEDKILNLKNNIIYIEEKIRLFDQIKEDISSNNLRNEKSKKIEENEQIVEKQKEELERKKEKLSKLIRGMEVVKR